MAKNQSVWAVDIGQAALKALKLAAGGTSEQVVAEAFDYIEYPKILSQPDADPEELVREALQTFLGRNDVKDSSVAISVPGQAGLVKFIKLPPVDKSRIPDIVKFEARQQIPFALEEVIWDYQQIGGGGDDDFSTAEVGLFAMKRDQINRAMLPFRAAGIEVDVVQMGPIALFNFIAFDRLQEADEKAKGSVVLLDIGADNTDLIITDGTRIWQRNVPIGGNHFTRALTKELKLTFAKAEHLKRNATKAPDPRAVFTAMRGVFSDFSSEVNRSIGFYSSVNRTAKIARIIGLGNGFKLPGLQKFLQQNLSFEVDKLEGFRRLAGDDVIAAPQFQENMMSFAVAYGLGVQGLGISGLRTNLLPPEITQARMIRRKKPWVLAASTLLLLGLTALFLSDWSAWAKVTSKEYDDVVKQANTVSTQGAQFKTDFESATAALKTKVEEGKSLVGGTTEPADWGKLLQFITAIMPAPAIEKKLNPEDPDHLVAIEQNRVYIDAIRPAYRTDLDAGWYAEVSPTFKSYMLAIDQQKPPSGAGWVIQLNGHHYNPGPGRDQGPINFLVRQVVPRFGTPLARSLGISHPVLGWVSEPDREWTGSNTGAASGIAAMIPWLARAEPPADSVSSTADLGGYGIAGVSESGGMGGSYGPAPMMMGGGYGMSSYSGSTTTMTAEEKEKEKRLRKLTRTDFLIQFVWKPDAPARPLQEIVQEIQEAEKGVPAGTVKTPSEKDVLEASQAVLKKAQAPPAAPGVPGAAAPGSTTFGTPAGGLPAAPPTAPPAAAPKR